MQFRNKVPFRDIFTILRNSAIFKVAFPQLSPFSVRIYKIARIRSKEVWCDTFVVLKSDNGHFELRFEQANFRQFSLLYQLRELVIPYIIRDITMCTR